MIHLKVILNEPKDQLINLERITGYNKTKLSDSDSAYQEQNRTMQSNLHQVSREPLAQGLNAYDFRGQL